jgi:hypothetical protein
MRVKQNTLPRRNNVEKNNMHEKVDEKQKFNFWSAVKKYRKNLIILVLLLVLGRCIWRSNAMIAIRSEMTLACVESLVMQSKRRNESCTFETIFPFRWDVAYVDGRAYAAGEYLKSKYNLEFTIHVNDLYYIQRMLFFYKGKLVKEFRYPIGTFDFPASVAAEPIYPQDAFEIEY